MKLWWCFLHFSTALLEIAFALICCSSLFLRGRNVWTMLPPWEMITELFSTAVRQCFLSLLAGCWPQITFLRPRGACRSLLAGMAFVSKTRCILVKPWCQVSHLAACHSLFMLTVQRLGYLTVSASEKQIRFTIFSSKFCENDLISPTNKHQ